VIFALDREAAPFRKLAKQHRLPVRILVSGVGRDAAIRAMESVGDASLVISAGFCGALNPALRIGDIAVCPFSGEAEALRSGARDLASALGSEDSASPLNLITVDHLVATPDAKRRLRIETGADVVDMEAEHVRAVCVERGIPFLAVKAVSDTADAALSPVLVNLLSASRVSPMRALAAAIRRPALLLEFRRLARATSFAAERLAEKLLEIISKKQSK
jgi:adenosylhomocysteine nucleosidase